AAGAGRGLPGPQSQRQLPAAPARPGRGGGTPAVRPPVLQRRGARLQHGDRAGAGRAGGTGHGLRAGGVLPGGGTVVTRWLPVALLAALLALLAAAPAAAEERILDYD